MKTTSGIHHITAITSDPQKNIDFYEGFLGQRMVKRTVNFDDPRSYHFYFGDYSGRPGTLITFFYFGKIPQGTRGVGEVSSISYSIPEQAKEFWIQRAKKFGILCIKKTNEFGEEVIALQDPDGIKIELVLTTEESHIEWWKEGDILEDAMLYGFYSATLTVENLEEMKPILTDLGYEQHGKSGNATRFLTYGIHARLLDIIEAPDLPQARQGTGSVHHIAFRVANDEDERDMRTEIHDIGLHPTPIIDRLYFHSVYFRTPSTILFEIATDVPGFTIDEPIESLGEHLVLPPHYEPHRTEIEQLLVPITLPRNGKI